MVPQLQIHVTHATLAKIQHELTRGKYKRFTSTTNKSSSAE